MFHFFSVTFLNILYCILLPKVKLLSITAIHLLGTAYNKGQSYQISGENEELGLSHPAVENVKG